ncbi:Cof-type HAD-IIB family hydrolase [Spirochaetota bacterium]
MPIKLIAIDLDDTLLTPELRIHAANLKAVQRALDAGIIVMLASGRTVESMMPFALELGMKGRGLPMICTNGAEVRDVDSGKIIRHLTLSGNACLTAIEVLRSYGLPVQAYDDQGIIVSERNSWTDRDCELTGLVARVASSSQEIAALPRSKLLSAGDPSLIARLAPTLKTRFQGIAEVVISKPYFIEILPLGADKGEALAWVAETHGLSRDDVMAIGDAGNDVGMVSWAAYGCAPRDARVEVLAVADYVSPLPHDSGAVAELIERLALGQKL